MEHAPRPVSRRDVPVSMRLREDDLALIGQVLGGVGAPSLAIQQGPHGGFVDVVDRQLVAAVEQFAGHGLAHAADT